jgi:hypothetical protein
MTESPGERRCKAAKNDQLRAEKLERCLDALISSYPESSSAEILRMQRAAGLARQRADATLRAAKTPAEIMFEAEGF